MTEIEGALAAATPDAADAAAHAARLAAAADRAGLVDVACARIDSPVGSLIAAATRRGLVRIAYGGDDVLDELARRISPRVLVAPARLEAVRRQLDEYFDGARRSFELELDWTLVTGFGRAVLRATAGIPYGSVLTYREVAAAAGRARAARAAGNALGANPLPIVVPCHRVVHSGGGLGGYTGGLPRKRALLALEGVALG